MKKHFLKDSALVAAFSIMTAGTGLLVDVLLAARFGLGNSTDAFYAAYTVPFLYSYIIIAIGQSTLIPIFARYIAQRTEDELWTFFSTVFNILALVSIVVTLIGALAAPYIVKIVTPGLPPETASAAIGICGILFLICGLSALAEVFRSFLYARGRFAVASSSNFLRNSVTVAAIYLFAGRYGITSAAWGFVAGYGVQFIVLLVAMLKHRPAYKMVINTGVWGLRETSEIGSVQVAGFMILQTITIGERFIGSFFPPGSITALSYASRIVFMAVETFAGSIAVSILPSLSAAVADDRRDDVVRLLDRPFRLMLLLFLPMATFTAVMGSGIIETLYQRGSFTPEATALTSSVFILYALSMPLMGFNRLIHNFLFASMKPRSSLTLFIIMTATTLLADASLVSFLGICALPVGYLIGTSAVFIVGNREFISGYYRLARREYLVFTTKTAVMTLLFGGVSYMMKMVLGHGAGLMLPVNLVVAFVAAAGIGVFAGLKLGIPELGSGVVILKNRIHRS